MLESQVGKTIDAYKIVRQLGTGGMGEVYLAEEVELHRLVAIKFLRSEVFDSQWKNRFLREAKILSTLKHKNICAFYRYGLWQDELPYIVFEYVEGITLEELSRAEKLSLRTSLLIGLQICEALEYLHSREVVHRDLKPANVMLLAGELTQPTVKVIDFGLAVSTSSTPSLGRLTQSRQLLGSPAYMSPEQSAGQNSDYRADSYALGCILFELISGKQVFQCDHPMALIVKHATESPPHLRNLTHHVPPRLDKLVHELLAKDPVSRPTLANVRRDLEQIILDYPDEVTLAAKGKDRLPIAFSALLLIGSTLLGVALTEQQRTTNSVCPTAEQICAEKSPSKREVLYQRYFESPTIPSTAATAMRFSDDGSGGKICEYQTVVDLKLNDLAANGEWTKALAFCDSCIGQSKSNLGSTNRKKIAALLELRKANCLLMCGDAKEASDHFASALVLAEGTNKTQAVIGLERSLVALRKYTEAENAILNHLHEQHSLAANSRSILYLELGRIKWINNDKAAASHYFALAGGTEPQQLAKSLFTRLWPMDLPCYFQRLELLGLVYLSRGDKLMAGNSIWIAVHDASSKKQDCESQRLRRTVLKLAGLPEHSAEDPYTIEAAEIKAWQTGTTSTTQLDRTISKLEKLLSPRFIIAEQYLRKGHLLVQQEDWQNVETATNLSLKNSDIIPGTFPKSGALNQLHVALCQQKRYSEALQIFNLAKKMPLDVAVVSILAKSHFIHKRDSALHQLYDELVRDNAPARQIVTVGIILVERLIEQRDFQSAQLLLNDLERKIPHALDDLRPIDQDAPAANFARLQKAIAAERTATPGP